MLRDKRDTALLRPEQDLAVLKAGHVQQVEVKRVNDDDAGRIIDIPVQYTAGQARLIEEQRQAAYQAQAARQQPMGFIWGAGSQAPQPSPLEALFGGPWR